MECNTQSVECLMVALDDTLTQKCYMWPSLMSKLHCNIGDVICIQTSNKNFICQVWPKIYLDGNIIEYSPLVSSTTNVTSSLVSTDTNDSVHVKLKHLQTALATNIEVKLIISNFNVLRKFKKEMHQSSELSEMCLNLLYKNCVAQDYGIDLSKNNLAKLYKICRVIIGKCEGIESAEAYIVDKNTSIAIRKVIGQERYEQSLLNMSVLVPGGLEDVAAEIVDLFNIPLLYKNLLSKSNLQLRKGILLRGPPGTGKTSLVKYIARHCEAFLITINGPEIFGSRPGETEENLNAIFKKAINISEEGPCILFMDEIDSLCPRRWKTEGLQEGRTTSQILTFLDSLVSFPNLFLIGATNRPASLDPALRRPGRFDKEVMINVPSLSHRFSILKIHTLKLPLGSDVDLQKLAMVTNGYVGADLASICQQAAYLAISESASSRKNSAQKTHSVEMRHFMSAIHNTMPSLQKGAEGLVDLSPVHWFDIGGLDDIKLQIQQVVEWPILHPESFTRMGLPLPKGVLLYGPPGCCKTTLVRAAATSSNATFLSLSGAQLYSPFVGDSEGMVSEVFQRARSGAPSIIFLDEFDSIIGKRSESSSQRSVQERVLSALLNEMDGIGIRLDQKTDATKERKLFEGCGTCEAPEKRVLSGDDNRNVLVVAATNRPDLLDNALLRPGRIDRIVYVPPPDLQARLAIFRVYTRRMPLMDVDLSLLAESTEHFTGADIESLCREAALNALTENLKSSKVKMEHFQSALKTVKPSLTGSLLESYSEYGTVSQPSFKSK